MDKRALRILMILALVLTPMLSALVGKVDAAALTEVSDTISDSGVSAESNHEITFVATSGVGAGEDIILTFDDAGDNFNLTGVAFGDVDLLAGVCSSETSRTLAATSSSTTWGVDVNTTTDVITIDSATDTITAGHCVIIRIGTNAAGGTNQIGNPSSANVYDLDVATTDDTGGTLLAILPHVTADVTVDETLTFSVTGQLVANCTEHTATAGLDTTGTSVSFGSALAETFYNACQEVAVSTNATGGYSVTVQQDGNLTSAAPDEILAGACDGTCDETTEDTWATATNNGFGYCVGNVTGTDAVATDLCDAGTPGFRTFGTLGTDTPEVIMSNLGVVSGSTIEVGYRISIDGTQPAGVYSNELIYVATPTY